MGNKILTGRQAPIFLTRRATRYSCSRYKEISMDEEFEEYIRYKNEYKKTNTKALLEKILPK